MNNRTPIYSYSLSQLGLNNNKRFPHFERFELKTYVSKPKRGGVNEESFITRGLLGDKPGYSVIAEFQIWLGRWYAKGFTNCWNDSTVEITRKGEISDNYSTLRILLSSSFKFCKRFYLHATKREYRGGGLIKHVYTVKNKLMKFSLLNKFILLEMKIKEVLRAHAIPLTPHK